jgi:hypothetical protein
MCKDLKILHSGGIRTRGIVKVADAMTTPTGAFLYVHTCVCICVPMLLCRYRGVYMTIFSYTYVHTCVCICIPMFLCRYRGVYTTIFSISTCVCICVPMLLCRYIRRFTAACSNRRLLEECFEFAWNMTYE